LRLWPDRHRRAIDRFRLQECRAIKLFGERDNQPQTLPLGGRFLAGRIDELSDHFRGRLQGDFGCARMPSSSARKSMRLLSHQSAARSSEPSPRLARIGEADRRTCRAQQQLGHVLFGQRLEANDLAPRADRGKLPLRARADEDQDRLRRRFFERFSRQLAPSLFK
jgi:hypothetical protein